MNFSHPLLFSLVPLLIVNISGLLTVLVFLFLRSKNPAWVVDVEIDKRHHSKLLNKWFKEYWYWVTTPVEKVALRFGLTPNFFTTFGFVLSVFAGLAFSQGMIPVGGWLMILGGTCDMFDGRIARKTKNVTASGAFYDSVMDRFGEVAVGFGLAGLYRSSWMLWFVLISVGSSLMVSYTRARGQAVGIDCQEGAMQRPERIVYLGVGSIFSPILFYCFPAFFKRPDYLLISAIILIACLATFTCFYRMSWIMKKLDAKSV